jgi:hypothetical protein
MLSQDPSIATSQTQVSKAGILQFYKTLIIAGIRKTQRPFKLTYYYQQGISTKGKAQYSWPPH